MSYKMLHRNISGEAYMRCNQVLIDNALDKAPVVRYTQERVISDDAGGCTRVPAGNVSREFDPQALITVVNPETGEPILDADGEPQKITQEALMVYVYSAYADAVTPAPAHEEETQV